MKYITIIILLFLFSVRVLYTQNSVGNNTFLDETHELKLKDGQNKEFPELSLSTTPFKKTDAPTGMFAGLIFMTFINPILVFEDKKIFWGLTKEISKSFYPFGRISFEYSFLFRTFNKHHLRFSYNYDIISQNRSDWIVFTFSPGAGFFTDTKNNGTFIQSSGGIFFPTPVFLAHLYLKYRFTKIFDEKKSDIHDISLGLGLVF